MTISAPKTAASLRALRSRSRLPAMSPTIAGIWASAMTRRFLAGSGMSETFARGLREAQCGTFSWQASQERVVDEGDAEYYFIYNWYYGGRIGDQCHGERASHSAESRTRGGKYSTGRPSERPRSARRRGDHRGRGGREEHRGLYKWVERHGPPSTVPRIFNRRDHADDPGRRLIFVDTNILIDVAIGNPAWADWSHQALASARARGPLLINAIVYAEFAIGFEAQSDCDAEIEKFDLAVAQMPVSAAFRAAQAFRLYRRSGGVRTRALPDFFIGAHASVAAASLLTRDVRRYRAYFPELTLIAPEG